MVSTLSMAQTISAKLFSSSFVCNSQDILSALRHCFAIIRAYTYIKGTQCSGRLTGKKVEK